MMTTFTQDNLQQEQIVNFGKKIFQGIGQAQPSAFNKNFWSGRIMEWSMLHPKFKLNMFRLVDVLPSLKSSRAISEHISEYLTEAGRDIHPLIGWATKVRPGSIRGYATALAATKGIEQMASQFIVGASPQKALKALKQIRARKLSFTVDLLGEFSVSEREASVYVDRYLEALKTFQAVAPHWRESAAIIPGHPGESSPVCISVKLSALYSQCSPLNMKRSVAILSERLRAIANEAQRAQALMYVDAEDSGNNAIIYQTFEEVFGSGDLKNYPYPGIVVQAYAKDSEALVLRLLSFAKKRGTPIAVRLVKGAYWDYETITSQLNNWESPLFAHKESSDAQFEHLSRILLDNHTHCLPAFGSHNVRSLAHACCYAESIGLTKKDFELQMLFGMADPIADTFSHEGYLVRLYAPLGDLLPGMGYFVRRLLENTSNESFLRHTFFDQDNVERLLKQPQQQG
jgi:RHH-type transcriptional regulator, proline utilization regulon repressor / proline dehydrogenase / delta 1-pyrroline-5-carboxylate dehydrogenase